jgi:hypothetical protein
MPGDMCIESHGGMIVTGENSLFIHQSSLAILPAESSSNKVGGTGKSNDEFLPYEVSLS